MITPEQEAGILKNARVPEHIPGLMAGLSGAEPFLLEDFLFFAGEDWLIFIGYPLEEDFHERRFSQILGAAIREHDPARVWFIAPRIPASLPYPVQPIENDRYYVLALRAFTMRGNLSRVVRKAKEYLSVERSRSYTVDHESLTREFLNRQELPPRVRQLYLRMPDYLARSSTSLMLSARNPDHQLSAFHVLESAAQKFIVYVIGCFSRERYAPYASDLLFGEMIREAGERQKEYIHLGLGVNAGIRRFKMKWGGLPSADYFAGEISCRPRTGVSWLRTMVSGL